MFEKLEEIRRKYDEIRTRLGDPGFVQDHRAGRDAQQTLGNAAHQPARKAGSTVGRHDDQLGLGLRGVIGNCAGHAARNHPPPVRAEPQLVRARYLSEQALGAGELPGRRCQRRRPARRERRA